MLTDDEIMAQVLAAFQEEQAEHRQAIVSLLLELERLPVGAERKDLIDRLFREAHSLKGGARAARQPEVEQIAHSMEDLFSAVRQGQLDLTPAVCDPVYAALQAIGVAMARVAAGAAPDAEAVDAALDGLRRAAPTADAPSPPKGASEHPPAAASRGVLAPSNGDSALPAATQPPAGAHATPAAEPPAPATFARTSTQEAFHAPEHPDALDAHRPPDGAAPTPKATQGHSPDMLSVRVPIATLDALLNETGELMAYTMRARQRMQDSQTLTDIPTRWRRIARQARPIASRLQSFVTAIVPTVHYLEGRQGFSNGAPRRHPASWYQERDVETLIEAFRQADALITDLERRLAVYLRQTSDDQVRLGAVTDRLYDQIRRARMLPLATILNPLRLQVRDMARLAGKQVHLVLDDGAAEADRQVLEALRDVLLHLLRNAIDHGVEAPAARLHAGKSAEGRICVAARVSGDRLALLVEDDGAGLNLEAIRQRAIATGLVGQDDLAAMADSDLIDLIFMPGFSTRSTVNQLSGRGVGLDIAQAQIQRIQGHINVRSVAGRGCRFEISVPLSLTSSQSLLLRVGADQYVLPLDAVQRIIAVQPREIIMVEGRPTITDQGKPILIVQLADVLGAALPKAPPARAPANQAGLAVVLGTNERQVACIVDAILGEQELVIHRLPTPLRRVRYISSATILADGTVVPILDVVDVVRGALGTRVVGAAQAVADPDARPRRVLVVDDSLTTRTLEKNILETAGYDVTLAVDGTEGLRTLRAMMAEGGCDVLLSDVDMPGLNGFELTSRVRGDDELQHMPIILVTSLDTPADRERGIAAGADAYIVKRSFDQQVLLETIKR